MKHVRRWAWFVVGLVLLGPVPAPAEFPQPRARRTTYPAPGIRLEAWVFSQPLPLRVWRVDLDLDEPTLEFVTTPKGRVAPPFETACQTTLAFAEEHHCIAAINASPFQPFRMLPGQPMEIVGLHLVDGEVVSPPESTYPALVLTRNRRASILDSPIRPEALKGQWLGVGGFAVVLRGGRTHFADAPTHAQIRHPRTAVGLSADGRRMVWLIVDGRQPLISEGVTYAELAELGRMAECADLLNLDGGGSTTLVVRQATTGPWEVVNTPVGVRLPGSLRLNGNHLGVRTLDPRP